MDRRNFLKTAGLSAVALGTASVVSLTASEAHGATPAAPGTATSGTYTNNPAMLTGTRWAMVIDTRKFTAPADFERVIAACHNEHNVPTIPGKQEVKWLWPDGFPQVFPDDPHGFMPDSIKYGNFLLLCNHCDNPPCVRVCPTQATFKQTDGTVVMDPHRCIGCRFCMAGCPYGARSFNFRDPLPFIENVNPAYPARTRGVVEKCTFCPERLAKGQLPACVEASNGAIVFGDLNDPDSPVRRALAENFTIRRKPTLGTGPGVYYII